MEVHQKQLYLLDASFQLQNIFLDHAENNEAGHTVSSVIQFTSSSSCSHFYHSSMISPFFAELSKYCL